MTKRVYLAGPMRGKPEYNFPAFRSAASRLRALGFEVWSPAEHDEAGGFDPAGMTGNEDLTELGFNLREALAADVNWIALYADAVACLPGWRESSGAQAEVHLAYALGLDVFDVNP